MFDVGFWEISLIGIVALLVVGPEKLPGLIRTTGRWIGRGQAMIRDLRYELEREADLDEIRKARGELKSVNDALNAGELNRFNQELTQSVEGDKETKAPASESAGD